jgi:NADH:ubiquinone oxidoreductase subunit E
MSKICVLEAILKSYNKRKEVFTKVELGGTFCMDKCPQGVGVTVNDSFHSVTPENVEEFFTNIKILSSE